MAGNVQELCWDCYDGTYYANSPGSDPRGPATDDYRVRRGGGWCTYAGATSCRTALRQGCQPIFTYYDIGFRLVRQSVAGPAGTNGAVKSATTANAAEVGQEPAVNAAAATNEAVEAQRKAAETLGIPVEKTLPRSGIALRLIPAGSFVMGSTEDEQDVVMESVTYFDMTPGPSTRSIVRSNLQRETAHSVTLTKAFYMGTYEVTQGQWRKVMESSSAGFNTMGDTAMSVTWHACTNFMTKLAMLEGMPDGSFRLPTEAEWEYACRAGTKTAFCYGDKLDSTRANCMDETYRAPHRATMLVGQFEPNAWGLYDMHGNVYEWCADWYGDYTRETTDPRGRATGSARVIRSGSWACGVGDCRSAARHGQDPAYGSGFRLVMPAGQQNEAVQMAKPAGDAE